MNARKLVASVSILGCCIGGPVILDYASGHTIQTTQEARAFSIWHILAPLAGAFLTQAMNPKEEHVHMATAPSIMLKTPADQYLPAIVSLRQQAVILRKRVKISKIKVGSNGNCLEKVRFFLDGRLSTMFNLESEPFQVGTDFIGSDARNKIFDTANDFWTPGEVYYIGFRALGERDEDVDGRHPGFNTIPVMILDDQPFMLAATDPTYRQFLTEQMGGLPAIPVSRMVTPDGEVRVSISPEQDIKLMQNQPMPVMENESAKTLIVDPAPGIVQPNQPVVASQKNEGLRMRAFVRNQPVGQSISLTIAEAEKTAFCFQAGELGAQTTLALFDESGKLLFPGKHMSGRTRTFYLGTDVQPGNYHLQVAAKGADNSFGEKLDIKITVKKEDGRR
ncbi:MAG: hypothetical protein AAB701_01055 [Patescibacteria group bacterium]